MGQVNQQQYQAEAKARWGETDAYKQSAIRVKQMGPTGLQKVATAMRDNAIAIGEHIGEDVNSTAVQELIKVHRKNICAFYDVTDEYYAGIAHMYVEDPRFTAHYEKIKPGLAQFLSDAMLASIKL